MDLLLDAQPFTNTTIETLYARRACLAVEQAARLLKATETERRKRYFSWKKKKSNINVQLLSTFHKMGCINFYDLNSQIINYKDKIATLIFQK